MRILTTSICYPNARQPDQGVFVQRRAEAIAALPDTAIGVVAPVPWCPVLRPNSTCEPAESRLPVLRPRMFSIPVLGWATDGWMFARALDKALRRIQRVDLIDAHFVYPDGVGAWLAGRRWSIPTTVTVRGKIVRMSKRAVQRLQIRAMLRGVDGRIAVSQSLAQWVHDVAGSDLHVDVIPNGIDTATFHLAARGQSRELLGWDADARYLLAVGHMTHHKGFDRLVEMLPALRQRCGDVRLVLAGSTRGERSFRRRVMQTIEQLDGVQLAGTVDPGTLNMMYNAADVFVSASRSEGWCNAISEALTAGTPVIATDVGGNREQICSTELGTLVPDGDGNALAEAVHDALSRTWYPALISAHGSARRWSHVAWETRYVFERILTAKAMQRRQSWVGSHRPVTSVEAAT